MGGSMGSVVGARFVRAVEQALEGNCPLIASPPLVAHVCRKH